MDAAGQVFISQGPLGASVFVLAVVVGLMARHIVALYKERDAIRVEQNTDSKASLIAVTKAIETVHNSQVTMQAQTEASKELLAVAKALLNKGPIQ